jgi:hypothetical protein
MESLSAFVSRPLRRRARNLQVWPANAFYSESLCIREASTRSHRCLAGRVSPHLLSQCVEFDRRAMIVRGMPSVCPSCRVCERCVALLFPLRSRWCDAVHMSFSGHRGISVVRGSVVSSRNFKSSAGLCGVESLAIGTSSVASLREWAQRRLPWPAAGPNR